MTASQPRRPARHIVAEDDPASSDGTIQARGASASDVDAIRSDIREDGDGYLGALGFD